MTAALLGTDRREPPELPAGPLADTVADALRPTPQGGCSRRSLPSRSPGAAAPHRCRRAPLQPPEPDVRPLLPARRRRAAAGDRLRVAGARGGVARRRRGERLASCRRRPRRPPAPASARPLAAVAVLAWGGALAGWLVDNVPDLAPADAAAPPTGAARALPVPARLEPLLDGRPRCSLAALAEGLASGEYRWPIAPCWSTSSPASGRNVRQRRRRPSGRGRWRELTAQTAPLAPRTRSSISPSPAGDARRAEPRPTEPDEPTRAGPAPARRGAVRRRAAALADADERPRPPQLAAVAVGRRHLPDGGRLDDGTEITPKYIGAGG